MTIGCQYATCILCAGSTQPWCAEPCLLLECTGCGFVFQATPPSDPMALYQRAEYDRTRLARGGEAAFARFPHDLHVARNRVRYVKPLEPRKGVWLDVGAGNGAMLVASEEAGFEAIGVELHPETAVETGAVLGRRVLSLAEALTAGFNQPAVVSFYDVFEHMVEPRGVLSCFAGRLVPGGVLAIEVPDAGSARARNLRGRWKHVKPDEHVGYFTQSALMKLVGDCGEFELCERIRERDAICLGGQTLRVPQPDKLHLIWKKQNSKNEPIARQRQLPLSGFREGP